MVNYHFASAATFLALTSLTAINIQAAERPTNLRRNDEHRRLRKLYGDGLSNSHFVSDTVTKCEEVMDGNPPVCIKVCVEVTSITSGEKLVDETSKVSQSKCESTYIDIEETTESPTNHPTYLATELVAEDDKTNIVTRTYSPDIMKLAGEKEEIESSSAIDWIGDGFPSTTTSDSNGVIQTGSSSKSSKNGLVSSSKGGKIASSTKSFKGDLVSSKSSKSIVGDVENDVVISNGWSGSAQTTSDNIIVSSKSSKYRTYSQDSSDVLDANGWYSSATNVDGESSSKSNKSGVLASDGSVGSSKSSKSEGLDETVAVANGWSGSAQTDDSSAIGSGSKSSKSEQVETAATSNGWSGSVQTDDSSAIGSGSKSSKSEEVETAATSNGWSGSAQTDSSAAGSGSKSSKSEEVDNVATSNGWTGSAQTDSSAIGSGSKSSKSEEVETAATPNGWSGSAQTDSSAIGSSSKSSKLQEPNGSVSSSKGGKGGDSGDANVEVMSVAKPHTSNAWQSSGWQ